MTDSWRLIDSEPCKATFNMSLDEAIAAVVRRGDAPPTLRLYEWEMPSVSIGCFQRIKDVDLTYCTERNIPIVRRPTGGRGILHNREITYSFSVKTTHQLFSKGLHDSYRKIGTAFSLALSKVGLSPEVILHRVSLRTSTNNSRSPLCFKSISYGEVTIKHRKIIGSAQKRWFDGLLQQGSLPYQINKYEIAKVFRLEPVEVGEKIIGLKEILPDLKLKDLKEAIRVSFEENFDIQLIPSAPSQEEVSLAEELEAKKYLSPYWNYKR
jgi:lipoate-protein ligase A